MSDETAAVFSMTPEAATAKLAEIGQQYQASQVPAGNVAPPAAGMATNPAEAAARLAALKADPNFRSRLLTGSAEQVREFQALTAMMASGDVQSDGLIETVDGLSDPNALRRADYESGLAALRDGGLNEISEQYLRDLDSGARTDRGTEGDALALKAFRDRMMRSPELRQKYLSNSNPKLTSLVNALTRTIALCATDGRPLSAEGRSLLAELETLR